jgi:hypothetical protein
MGYGSQSSGAIFANATGNFPPSFRQVEPSGALITPQVSLPWQSGCEPVPVEA